MLPQEAAADGEETATQDISEEKDESKVDAAEALRKCDTERLFLCSSQLR